jgi:threonine dehydratase
MTTPTPASSPILSLADMQATAARLAPHIVRTPVTPLHGRHVGPLLAGMASVHLKLELFQRTGTFKARGALNAVMALDGAARARGITAASAGNHAVAAAFAAQAAGTTARILVQSSANPVRLALTRSYGAEVILAPDGAAAFAGAEQLVRDEGRTMIHPFDGPLTSLGTATLGLELVDQLPDVDAVVIAIGGGGLASGVAAAVKALRPGCRIFGVEPEGANAMTLSFASGEPTRLSAVKTIADSLGPPMTLPYSLALCRAHIERVVTVSDDAICHAMALQFHDAKLAVEPAGAAALAGAIGPLRDTLRGLRVALIVCGANIDRESFNACLARGESLLAA